MPLKLYLRHGVYHYSGTIGPTERRSRLRGSCRTTDKDVASRQIAEIETNYWKGHFDGPGSVLTFRRAALLYRAAGKSATYLEKAEVHFKDTLVKDITAGTIRQMAIELYPGCTGASRNRMGIVPVQAVINHAAESELCSTIRVKRFKVDAKVKEPATLEWINAFCQHAGPHMGALALFMYVTGARIGEALSVRWEDVDLKKAKTALIRETKQSKERLAHLPQRLVVALANLDHIKDRPVFIYRRPDDIGNSWDVVIEKAGIKRLTPHSCRHGFATGLLRRGIDVVTVAKLGGWKTPAQVLRTYGHAIENRKLTDVLLDADLTQVSPANELSSDKTGTSLQ